MLPDERHSTWRYLYIVQNRGSPGRVVIWDIKYSLCNLACLHVKLCHRRSSQLNYTRRHDLSVVWSDLARLLVISVTQEIHIPPVQPNSLRWFPSAIITVKHTPDVQTADILNYPLARFSDCVPVIGACFWTSGGSCMTWSRSVTPETKRHMWRTAIKTSGSFIIIPMYNQSSTQAIMLALNLYLNSTSKQHPLKFSIIHNLLIQRSIEWFLSF